MFGLIKIVTAAVGLLSLVPAVHASGLFESKSYSGLQRRQGIAGTGCFEIDVALLGIVLAAEYVPIPFLVDSRLISSPSIITHIL